MRIGLAAGPASGPCNGIGSVFFTVGGMLMDADGRGIDHLDVTVISL